MKNKFIVSYDIQNNKKRREIVKILEDYGSRWQFSVFHCYFSITEKVKVLKKIESFINKKTDSVLILPLSQQTFDNSIFFGKIEEIIDSSSQPSFF